MALHFAVDTCRQSQELSITYPIWLAALKPLLAHVFSHAAILHRVLVNCVALLIGLFWKLELFSLKPALRFFLQFDLNFNKAETSKF